MSNLPGTKRLLAYFVLGAGLAVCALAAYTWAQVPAEARRTTAQAAPKQAAPETLAGALPKVTVYKSATCNCCAKWARHMEQAGFPVEAKNVSDLGSKKNELGVPQQLRSCHTARVNGEVVEGHVPADVVKRYLASDAEKAQGLAVPGMPVGSPGMEVEGRPAQPYEVIAFRTDGRAGVYAQR